MIDRDQFFDMLQRVANDGVCGQPRPYSGRVMYGEQCIAVSGDYLDEWALAVALGHQCRCWGLDIRDLPSPDSDSLGRGRVLYWRQYGWPDDQPEPADEDED
jgi:hypothetical protein